MCHRMNCVLAAKDPSGRMQHKPTLQEPRPGLCAQGRKGEQPLSQTRKLLSTGGSHHHPPGPAPTRKLEETAHPGVGRVDTLLWGPIGGGGLDPRKTLDF